MYLKLDVVEVLKMCQVFWMPVETVVDGGREVGFTQSHIELSNSAEIPRDISLRSRREQ